MAGTAAPTPPGVARGISSTLARELRSLSGVAEVLERESELFPYESDALTLLRESAGLVVFPLTTEAVSAVVSCCNRHGVPFVPRGAGTGLSGGATPVPGSVLVECSRMSRILEIDATNRTATVEPGLVNQHLSDAVAPLGLCFAPDPSSQSACTIGGNVAENSGGPHTLKYGTTSPHVLSIEVVLPDGSVTTLGRRDGHLLGYDLRGAFVGSEGTLGIATAVTVRLVPIPETVATLLVSFRDLIPACETVSEIIGAGIVPAALELMDDRTIAAIEDSVFAAGYPREARAVLLVELDGSGPASRATRPSARPSGGGAREPSVPWADWRPTSTSTTPWFRARGSPRSCPGSTGQPSDGVSESQTFFTPGTATCTRTSPSIVATPPNWSVCAKWVERFSRSASRRAEFSRGNTGSASKSATTWSCSTPRRTSNRCAGCIRPSIRTTSATRGR